jgi:hypothetical protein
MRGYEMGKWINKSYVILILLITILTGQIEVKAKSESSESIISEVLKDDKTKTFLIKNEALIESLREQEETIAYSLESSQEYPYQFDGSKGENAGVLPQMIQLFEQLTQVTFEQVSDVGTKDEMMAKLEAGDIRLLFGLTMSYQAKAELETKYKKCKINALKDDLFFDPFVLIGQVQEEGYTRESLPNYYWGCLEDQYTELAQTVLMNHTVTYNTFTDLEAAYREGTIQGMFLTQGLERYISSLDQLEYTNIPDVSLQASKYYCIAKNDKELNKLLPKMIQLYLSLYEEYYQKEIPLLKALPKESELRILRYLPMIALGVFTIAFLTGSVVVIKRQRENKKMLRILKRIPNKLQREQEVLFVLLRKSKIRSKQHFRVFGLEQKHPRKTFHMQELTKRIGFDFTKHYAFLVKNQEKEFTRSFDLYIGGVAYNFEEVGIYQENVIVSKIYRREK